MKRVLIIAYYFPPMGLSGVQRTLKFAKYLPAYGWHPTVLTVLPRGYYAYDASLEEELIETGIQVVRTGSADPTRIYKTNRHVEMPREWIRKLMNRTSQTLFIPDNKIGWKKSAVPEGLKLLKNDEYELIFSTAPPFTDHVIGRDLANKTNVPLVLDYRDAWLDYQFAFYATPFHKYAHYQIEKSCCRAARKIVVVNRVIKIKLLEHYKFLNYNNVHIIPHGYDPEDFSLNGIPDPPDSHTMCITHTGTFIEDITPVPLLKALHKVFTANPQLKGRIKVIFAGIFRKEYLKIVRRLGLQQDVEILGYVKHRECTRLLMNSDVLYIALGKGKNREHITTSRLYDYIGARKPILASVPEGVVRRTVEEMKTGVITDPGNVNQLSKALLDLFEKFKRRELAPIESSIAEKYDRRRLTGDLAQLFTRVLQESV